MAYNVAPSTTGLDDDVLSGAAHITRAKQFLSRGLCLQPFPPSHPPTKPTYTLSSSRSSSRGEANEDAADLLLTGSIYITKLVTIIHTNTHIHTHIIHTPLSVSPPQHTQHPPPCPIQSTARASAHCGSERECVRVAICDLFIFWFSPYLLLFCRLDSVDMGTR